MDKLLVQFSWDVRRMGKVEGLFITTAEELEAAYDKPVSFGEILGKHSNVDGVLERGDITVKSDDQDFIAKLEELLGSTISGYNPLSYIEDEDPDA